MVASTLLLVACNLNEDEKISDSTDQNPQQTEGNAGDVTSSIKWANYSGAVISFEYPSVWTIVDGDTDTATTYEIGSMKLVVQGPAYKDNLGGEQLTIEETYKFLYDDLSLREVGDEGNPAIKSVENGDIEMTVITFKMDESEIPFYGTTKSGFVTAAIWMKNNKVFALYDPDGVNQSGGVFDYVLKSIKYNEGF